MGGGDGGDCSTWGLLGLWIGDRGADNMALPVGHRIVRLGCVGEGGAVTRFARAAPTFGVPLLALINP